MANQLFTRKGGDNEAEVWEGRKGGVRLKGWRVIGINWQKKERKERRKKISYRKGT